MKSLVLISDTNHLRKFLSGEFCIENILFWKDVESFRKKLRENRDEAFIAKEHTRLYNKFITEDSPFTVNIQANVASRIRTAVENKEGKPISVTEVELTENNGKPNPNAKTPPTIFDEAQNEIYRLMISNSFERYKESALFEEFAQKIVGK